MTEPGYYPALAPSADRNPWMKYFTQPRPDVSQSAGAARGGSFVATPASTSVSYGSEASNLELSPTFAQLARGAGAQPHRTSSAAVSVSRKPGVLAPGKPGVSMGGSQSLPAQVNAKLAKKPNRKKSAPQAADGDSNSDSTSSGDGDISGISLYKTELCRSFEETGMCRYGLKCQFAHGRAELRPVARHPKYKTEICKTWQANGTCPYGTRCRFIHSKDEDFGSAFVPVAEVVKSVARPPEQPEQPEKQQQQQPQAEASSSAPAAINSTLSLSGPRLPVFADILAETETSAAGPSQ